MFCFPSNQKQKNQITPTVFSENRNTSSHSPLKKKAWQYPLHYKNTLRVLHLNGMRSSLVVCVDMYIYIYTVYMYIYIYQVFILHPCQPYILPCHLLFLPFPQTITGVPGAPGPSSSAPSGIGSRKPVPCCCSARPGAKKKAWKRQVRMGMIYYVYIYIYTYHMCIYINEWINIYIYV